MKTLPEKITFQCGGWENGEAEIRFNEELDVTGGGSIVQHCKHCTPIVEKEIHMPDGREWVNRYSTCPRVIVAYNEAGCCTTGVCLDCLLETVVKYELN